MALTFLEPKEGNAFSFFRLDKAEILSKDERPENRPPLGKFVCREAVAERLVFSGALHAGLRAGLAVPARTSRSAWLLTPDPTHHRL